MDKILESNIENLIAVCRSLKIKRLYAFGSVFSGNFSDKSDIDFLTSFVDNLTVEEYTNNYFELQYKLRDLLKRDIDIVTERTLSNPYFIESVNESKRLIYEA
jgi:predicted nucleotidyltransferase